MQPPSGVKSENCWIFWFGLDLLKVAIEIDLDLVFLIAFLLHGGQLTSLGTRSSESD